MFDLQNEGILLDLPTETVEGNAHIMYSSVSQSVCSSILGWRHFGLEY